MEDYPAGTPVQYEKGILQNIIITDTSGSIGNVETARLAKTNVDYWMSIVTIFQETYSVHGRPRTANEFFGAPKAKFDTHKINPHSSTSAGS